MTEIHIEKKPRVGLLWLWLVIFVAVVAILLWWLWPSRAVPPEIGTVPVPPVTSTVVVSEPARIGGALSQTSVLPVGAILDDPMQWQGKIVSGPARVAATPTDRGFWIQDGDRRIFAVVNESGTERPNIQPDSVLTLGEATVRTPSDIALVPGDLDADTRRILEGVKVFLTVDAEDIKLTS